MAELAIPIIALGSLYILSDQERKNKNKNNNINNINNNNNNVINNLVKPIEKKVRFLDNQNNQNNEINEIKESFDNLKQNNKQFSTNTIKLMNGQEVERNEFNHNNMQPYFGAKIRGATKDLNYTESILDNKQGYGSQSFNKVEQAPLFKPDEYNGLQYGTQNNSDFFQSRINESMKMSNVTLWEPQRVGPGLNSNNQNGSDGFNSGMMARETWMPKSVDDLRVDNNPKMTFDLNGHQGPANSIIKTNGSNDKIGKVEKHLPDKFYDSGPQRWFTTTGAEKNPPIRSNLIIPNENRVDTTSEYYGAGGCSQGQATYTDIEFEKSKKQNLGQLPFSNATATGQNYANPNDYSSKSYNILPNNRTTDKNEVEFGGVYGMAKSVIAPLLDILKPSRKENVIGNIRQSGNVNGTVPTSYLFNNNDKTKVTNREMTTDKIGMNHLNVQAQDHGLGEHVSKYQNIQNQRATTNHEYVGSGVASNVGLRPYNAEYAQQNNVNKTYELHPNQGNMSLFNNNTNMAMNRNEKIFENSRTNIPNGGPNLIPSAEFMGELNGIQTYDQNFNNSRMDNSLLNAFKNNPYTKSLSSVA
tara:strand:+ start:3933 stop:5687 length:1755 start_codon:yes stop_codon:yes gene_type:complete